MNSNENETPKIEVSVIIPAFNAGAFLREAIESVFNQTLKGVELIVVDDGSTDETASIARSFGARVKYVYQKNGGIAAARNRGLKEAKGEFIASLDADDYFISRTKLERQVEAIKQSDDCGLILSGWINVDQNGVKIEKREPWKYASRLDLKDIVTWSPFLPSVMLFRREALLAVAGFDPHVKIIEDFDIVVRLIFAGFSVNWLTEVTTAYRLHEGNITRNIPSLEKEFEDYLGKLFAREDLPKDVRSIERKIRFVSRIRMAFRYFEAGNFFEMKRALLDSMEFSDLKHGGLLFYWLESFRGYDPKINLFKLLDSNEWKELIDLRMKDAN
jgi:glycosyltransferase involved in cell wall biosynthesis